MQTPQLPRPFLNGKGGSVVALAGSTLSLFSFCAFPFASGFSCFLWCSSYTDSFFRAFSHGDVFSWVLFVINIIACIVALIGTLHAGSPALAIGLIVFGFIGVVLYVLTIINVVNTPNASVAIGSWLCLFGMIVATISGIAATMASRHFVPPNPG